MSRPTSPLPARPSLEQLRKRAKELLRACRAGDGRALARIRAYRADVARPERVRLSDTQLVTAREHGFASWGRLKHHVESLQRPADYDEPVWGKDTWPFLVAALEGDEDTVRRMLERDPLLVRAEYAYLQPLHYAVRGGHVGMFVFCSRWAPIRWPTGGRAVSGRRSATTLRWHAHAIGSRRGCTRRFIRIIPRSCGYSSSAARKRRRLGDGPARTRH